MMRLFIACPLPSEVKATLGEITDDLRARGGSVKWVDSINLHLTIRFLGNTEENLLPKIKAAIDHHAPTVALVNATIDRLGAFPNLRRPRVIWAGLNNAVAPLKSLTANIELAMQDLGFEPEKKGFKPHLTIGRVKQPHGLDELTRYLESYRLEPITVAFDRLVLFKSTITPKGPIYESLHQAPFRSE